MNRLPFLSILILSTLGCSSFRVVSIEGTPPEGEFKLSHKITAGLRYEDKTAVPPLNPAIPDPDAEIASGIAKMLPSSGVDVSCIESARIKCSSVQLLEIELSRPLQAPNLLRFPWILATALSFGIIPYFENEQILIHAKYTNNLGKSFFTTTAINYKLWLSIFAIPLYPKHAEESSLAQSQYISFILRDLQKQGAFE